ncbi:hypothetical protein NDU88_002782 [Pleurodeles waltl]|uniref:Uncharacterized protein n=1 Tax=Pleurodeles waltl TaxID=8319 RepID=A0AAV7MNQ9_PLEWA|nr:hypothetical protein NDU88_002782 [Pleurodeles waltl]
MPKSVWGNCTALQMHRLNVYSPRHPDTGTFVMTLLTPWQRTLNSFPTFYAVFRGAKFIGFRFLSSLAFQESQAQVFDSPEVLVGTFTRKAVQHRVGNAVQAGQKKGEVVHIEYLASEATVILKQASNHNKNVVRPEADEEYDAGTKDQLLDLELFLLLSTMAFTDYFEDAAVGEQQ